MYSKGEFLLGDVSPRAEAALAYFLAAIARDSTFAQAYLGVARSYVSMGLHGRVPPSEVRLEARAAAQRALALDNKLTDAYAVLGTLSLLYDWDWDAAAREFARLSENQLVHGTLVLYRIILGDSLEAIQMARQVVESDALSPQKNLTMAWALWMVGRCDDAVQRLLELRGLYPQYAWAHVELAWNYVCLGDYPNAAAAADEAEKLVASEENLRASLAYVYAKVGRSGDARRILRELEEIGKERYIDQGKLVAAYAALGDTTMALNALEAAFAAGSPELAFLRAAPADFYDTIRSHQRFIEVVKRLRFPRRNRAASETDPE
jgi:serine/threonine-protein kinase